MCGALLPQAMTESYMLQELYAATGGLSWENAENWLREDVSVCDWFGVSCEIIEGKAAATEVALPNNNLVGLVPSIVFYLPALKRLDLGRNQVWVKFGDIQYSVLEELSLDETNLVSLEGISKASNLRTLDLQKTELTDQAIPDELYSLVNLTVLSLEACGITGQLSENLGNLKKLKTLLLDRNALSGQLPSSLAELTDLEDLFLSDNNFWGTLPPQLNGLPSLRSLFLDSSNKDRGGISGPLLSFSNMPKLRSLHLGSNSLTGPIPDDLMAGVDNLNEVVEIDIASNHLSGSIPTQLSAFSKLKLDFTDNYITSIDGSLCSKSSWQEEAVGTYACSAIVCPQGTYNQFGRQSSVDTPCLQCPGASVSPYLGRRSCLNDEKAKERHILELFYNATDGLNWKNNNGWLDGDTDYCNWYGIACVASVVDTVTLGSNNLVGKVPADIFQLWSLRALLLYANPIEFHFDGIRKASKLVDLRLDSTGLKSLDGLADALSLVDVDVRFNRLQGELPDLSNLSNLRTFSCSSNRLSGSLPTFSENPALVSLRASGNVFSGQLPAFDTHHFLQALDVSENELSGPIPENLLAAADPSAKTFIDLSSNRFTGAIPFTLSRFTDLTIYVRDNHIDALPAALCAMTAWNQGDVSLDGCDAIACPPQTYSASTGRASRGGYKCEPCAEARFFGETSCGGFSDVSDASSIAPSMPFWIGGIFFSILSMTLCSFF
jgi:Leucine-rich repeat (LRR) protein